MITPGPADVTVPPHPSLVHQPHPSGRQPLHQCCHIPCLWGPCASPSPGSRGLDEWELQKQEVKLPVSGKTASSCCRSGGLTAPVGGEAPLCVARQGEGAGSRTPASCSHLGLGQESPQSTRCGFAAHSHGAGLPWAIKALGGGGDSGGGLVQCRLWARPCPSTALLGFLSTGDSGRGRGVPDALTAEHVWGEWGCQLQGTAPDCGDLGAPRSCIPGAVILAREQGGPQGWPRCPWEVEGDRPRGLAAPALAALADAASSPAETLAPRDAVRHQARP